MYGYEIENKAYLLYREFMPLPLISDRLGVSEITLERWRKVKGWKARRQEYWDARLEAKKEEQGG